MLAGGLSTRMGRPKATLLLGGKPLWNWAAEAIAPVCSEVFVSVRQGTDLPGTGLRVLTDLGPGGPLAAIATGLQRGDALVLACDMPLVPTSFFERLCADTRPAEVLLYGDGAGLQPTAALYRASFLPAAERALQAGAFSLQKLVASRPHARLGPGDIGSLGGSAGWFLNINRPEDLERAKMYLNRREVK